MKYTSELYETNKTKDYSPELISTKQIECEEDDLVASVLDAHDQPLDPDYLSVHEEDGVIIISIPEGEDDEQFLGYFRVEKGGL